MISTTKSNKKLKTKLPEEKIYTKTEVLKMLDEYCSHVMTSIIRKEEHVKISDYLEQPSLINQDVVLKKYRDNNKMFGLNG